MLYKLEKCEMDETFDLKRLNNNKNMENITPHKIAVVAFIREFGLLKGRNIIECYVGSSYRKDFCILALKLIQCPDMEFKELEHLLTNGKYNLLSVHLQNFCVRLQHIYVNGIGALTDCVASTEKLMTEHNEIPNSCVIIKASVLGLYLRRIIVYMDKLSFAQLSHLHKCFCIYYQKGRPGLMIRSLSKEKLNTTDQIPSSTPSTSPVRPEDHKHEHCVKHSFLDKDCLEEHHQWSMKQAELFTAQQAKLLQINEQKALPPHQLQQIIKQIINDNPEYPDVHFLSFLNCLRMKEFCGAQDSLYNCFDRSIFASQNANSSCSDRNKNFRYAALNRAAMHAQFGHNEVAMEGVSEALGMAQHAGDGACLAHVVGWAARAGGRAYRAALLARSPRAPRAAPAAAAAAAAAQFLAQHVAVNGARPDHVFSLITKGEAISYLHSMTDFTMSSLANTAALWSLYGKTEMASVNCQLLLNLNTKFSGGGGADACGVAGMLAVAARRGELANAALLASNFCSRDLPLVLHAARAERALNAGKWEEASQNIQQLASYDRWESQLLKAEMYYLQGEPTDSLDTVQDVLDHCKTEDDSLHYMSFRLRAMILVSQVKHAFGGVNATDSSNIILLNEVLSLAKKYHLHYLAATAEMHIANVQLHLGCVINAHSIVKRALPTIMAHGGAYDMARGLLLYSKIRVARAPAAGEARAAVLLSCCETLDTVKKHFIKADAHSRQLEICYLQAQLYNEIGNHAARNECAWSYRQLEAQYNVEPTTMFFTSY